MRILSITAGAAGMYCGSCFRDNALAAELLKRGHDATPGAGLHADAHRRTQRQRATGALRRHQRLPAAVVAAVPPAAARSRSPVGLPGVIGAFANRSASSTDPALLGELTVATLEGRSGVLAREFDKLIEWTRDEPPPDVINLPNSLLDRAWRRRCARPSAGPCAARCRARSCSSTACCRRIASACST